MKIKMLKTTPGSIDGVTVSSYEADLSYDLSRTVGERDLANAFVGASLAEIVVDGSMSARVGAALSDLESKNQPESAVMVDTVDLVSIETKSIRKGKGK